MKNKAFSLIVAASLGLLWGFSFKPVISSQEAVLLETPIIIK